MAPPGTAEVPPPCWTRSLSSEVLRWELAQKRAVRSTRCTRATDTGSPGARPGDGVVAEGRQRGPCGSERPSSGLWNLVVDTTQCLRNTGLPQTVFTQLEGSQETLSFGGFAQSH